MLTVQITDSNSARDGTSHITAAHVTSSSTTCVITSAHDLFMRDTIATRPTNPRNIPAPASSDFTAAAIATAKGSSKAFRRPRRLNTIDASLCGLLLLKMLVELVEAAIYRGRKSDICKVLSEHRSENVKQGGVTFGIVYA